MTETPRPVSNPARQQPSAATILNVLSTLAACVAAVCAAWAVTEANRATRAGVLQQYLTEYASPEIYTAIEELRSWQGDHPKDLAIAFKALLSKKQRSVEEEARFTRLDASRRRVSKFFERLQVMSEQHLIDENLIGLLWTKSTYRLIADILVPIERARVEAWIEVGRLTEADRADARHSADSQLAFYARALQVNDQGNAFQPK